MTTKQQERDALKKIQKIVEGLGEDSYIATAFAGCFEIADQNIEFDFGDSMKGRLELAEAKVEELTNEREALVSQLDSAKISLKRAEEQAVKEREAATAELAEAKKHILSDELYKDLWVFLTDEAKRCRELMAAGADIMADMADTPKDVAFEQAVINYRKSKARAVHCEKMADEIEKIGLEE